jgi:hypothetical protein
MPTSLKNSLMSKEISEDRVRQRAKNLSIFCISDCNYAWQWLLKKILPIAAKSDTYRHNPPFPASSDTL